MNNVSYLPTVQHNNGVHSRVHHFNGAPDYGPEETGTLSLFFIVEVVQRNLLLGALLIPLCCAIGVLVTTYLTPIYKSPAVLHIQSSYFREPLVNDVISEESNQSELKARRDSLIQLSLDDEFLLSLLDEFPELQAELELEEFQKPYSEEARAWVLYTLRDRIEYFGLSGSTFRVGAMASSPSLALAMNRAFIDRILYRMADERSGVLKNTKRAISDHVRQLAAELNAIEQSLKVSDEHTLSEQHRRLQADLESLLVQYTEKHPKVSNLRREVRSVETRLRAFQKSALAARKDQEAMFESIPRSEAAKQPTQDVYNELLKKLSYLQIALSLETEDASQHLRIVQQPTYPIQPVFPRIDMFAFIGALVGLLLWVVGIVVREAKRAHPEAADLEMLASTSNVAFLGRLPLFEPSVAGVDPNSPIVPPYEEPKWEPSAREEPIPQPAPERHDDTIILPHLEEQRRASAGGGK